MVYRLPHSPHRAKLINFLITKPKYCSGPKKILQFLDWRIYMIEVVKRDGTRVPFDKQKIINAINGAFIEVDG